MRRFFGYKHWTLENNPRCFYVGKGLEGRAQWLKQRSRKHRWVQETLGCRIEVCSEFFTETAEIDALQWEVENIVIENSYTTQYAHTLDDIRCNFTKGGEGVTGNHVSRGKGRKLSPQECARISIMRKGKPTWSKGKKIGSRLSKKGWETRRKNGNDSPYNKGRHSDVYSLSTKKGHETRKLNNPNASSESSERMKQMVNNLTPEQLSARAKKSAETVRQKKNKSND